MSIHDELAEKYSEAPLVVKEQPGREIPQALKWLNSNLDALEGAVGYLDEKTAPLRGAVENGPHKKELWPGSDSGARIAREIEECAARVSSIIDELKTITETIEV